MRFSIRNPEKLHLQLCLVSSNIQEAMDVLSLRGTTERSKPESDPESRGLGLGLGLTLKCQ